MMSVALPILADSLRTEATQKQLFCLLNWRFFPPSDVEAEFDNVAIAHEVLLAFDANLAE
jgi:hypothetical protein